MSVEDQLADLNRAFGELAGLFKAHIHESERERGDQRLEREADRLDRRAIGDSIHALREQSNTTAAAISPLQKKVEDHDKSIRQIEFIWAKITIAVAIVSGGVVLAFQAVQAVWPFIASGFKGWLGKS